MSDSLDLFHPAVSAWFRATYGQPTPPQALGWPAIQRGEHILILSPTGSGKTMAAFLWGINAIITQLIENPDLPGVQLLYISPLKALNNDIERNLRAPLAGIRKVAREQFGVELPPVRVAVRTGDTPTSARQSQARKPPHILITTPESLYLILTSPTAHAMLAPARTVILDEIHTLCGNKRGAHLSLSLERLTLDCDHQTQRIGLSATQRPLDEVARYLVGQEWERDEATGQEQLASREVTIVDAGAKKDLDLQVVTAVPDLRRLPGGSVWPAVIPQVLGEIRTHHTTLIFVNGRRAAERAADRLNEQFALEEEEEVAPGSSEALLLDGAPKGEGMFGTGRTGGPFYAHHGSVSKERRLTLEQKLKDGQLPALIGTSSLELGIDIGSVDLVVQLQSPRSVARGLQRVGRAGHLVGQTSSGRIYATYREDLLDAAAVAHGMLHGDIEPTYAPQNCLDVLAQQIVAAVSVRDWPAADLYRLCCQAYGYHGLTREAFDAVVKMLSGGYGSELYQELRPRIAHDRVRDRLAALPGSRLLALRNGGTIADRGEFRVYLPDRKTLLGALDEEFVFETRRGDVFTLGSGTWRVLDVEEDKLVVGDAAGSVPRMPFWRGEAPRRDYYMGRRLGAFRRALAARVRDLPPLPDDPAAEWPAEAEPVIRWLMEDYVLDEPSARNAILYVRQQLEVMGAISSDQCVIVERFTDALGDQRMAIHSPFGGRINSAWALALAHAYRDQMGLEVETQVNDDGILYRFLQADREPPTDLVRSLGPEEARERLLLELPNSALFGAQFRMNAARALMLPKASGAKGRTPFWLQRLRAKDLLAVGKGLNDFPLVAETYRDCLRDVLDLEHLMELLGAIRSGAIQVVEAETLIPSPVAGSLLFDFINVYMYEGDMPKAEMQAQALALNRELLSQLLDEGMLPSLLKPEAIEGVQRELQHLADGYRARSAEELAVILHELGDLTADEVRERSMGEGRAWLLRLAAEGRALELDIPTASAMERRWIAAEDYVRYRDAFELPEPPPPSLPDHLLENAPGSFAARELLLRVLARSRGPMTLDAILARYAFPPDWLEGMLDEMVASGHLIAGLLSPGANEREWCERRVLERIHRRTLSLLRQEIQPVSLAAYADFAVRWQGLHPAQQRCGRDGLVRALQQLRGLEAQATLWERDLLPARLADFRPDRLDALCAEGDLVWAAVGDDPRRARLRFFFRGEGALLLPAPPPEETDPALSDVARAALDYIRGEGACYAADIQRGLGLSQAELDRALVELTLAGLATNDHYGALRQVVGGEVGAAPQAGGLRSSLDEQLTAWRATRSPSGVGNRPAASRLREARDRVARRMPALPQTPAAPRWPGRWSLLRRPSVLGPEPTADERSEAIARLLLLRYGIVTRECLENESIGVDWTTLYPHYQLMEMRGEVRRGYFVRGLPGIQFALPDAVDHLCAWDEPEAEDADALVVVNACDPANLYGPALDAAGAARLAGLPAGRDPSRFSRLSSNYVVLQRGVPVLLYEHGGDRWTSLAGVSDETTRRAIRLLLAHLTRVGGLCAQPPRVRVESWNGSAPVGGEGQSLLEGLGFRREPPAMVWDGL